MDSGEAVTEDNPVEISNEISIDIDEVDLADYKVGCHTICLLI